MTTELKKLVTLESVNVFLKYTGCSTLEELEEKIDSEVLEWLRNEFPDKTVSLTLLDGSDRHGYNRIEYHKAVEQEECCRACREAGAYFHCYSGGLFWDVESTQNGRFITTFRECALKRTAERDREKARERRSEASPIKLFSGKQGG